MLIRAEVRHAEVVADLGDLAGPARRALQERDGLIEVAQPVVHPSYGVEEQGIVARLEAVNDLECALQSFGLALVIQEVIRWIFGGTNLPYATPSWAVVPVNIGIGYYPPWRLVIVGVTIAVVLVLYLFLRYTRFGLVVRAGMRDPEMLRFLGIDVPKRFTIVFGLGALIAGIAGGALIGWVLDRWLETSPWLLLALMFLGIGVAFRNIIRISNERPE